MTSVLASIYSGVVKRRWRSDEYEKQISPPGIANFVDAQWPARSALFVCANLLLDSRSVASKNVKNKVLCLFHRWKNQLRETLSITSTLKTYYRLRFLKNFAILEKRELTTITVQNDPRRHDRSSHPDFVELLVLTIFKIDDGVVNARERHFFNISILSQQQTHRSSLFIYKFIDFQRIDVASTTTARTIVHDNHWTSR